MVKETVLVKTLHLFRSNNLTKTGVKKYPFHLLFGYGDPDEGNVMIFKKE